MSVPQPHDAASVNAPDDRSAESWPSLDQLTREVYEARKALTEGVAHVYVPTRPRKPAAGEGPRPVQFELRQLADGTNALPVYTDNDLLTAQLGSFQPRQKIAVLELLLQISAAKVPVVLNPPVDAQAPRWTQADLQAWRRENA